MQRFARVVDGIVLQVIDVPDGIKVADVAHPDIVATFVGDVPLEVAANWTFDGSVFSAPPPLPEPEPVPIVIPGGTFFNRLTEAEADELDEAMMVKPVKYRRAWQSASSFDERTDLWPVLNDEIVSLFGDDRAEQLLAAAV